jgi:DNA-binding NtrC family response regulator
VTYNILLVDDDYTQLDTVDSVIKNKMHYNTLRASCGQDAIKMLTSDAGKNVDLVLLDLSMPDVSGIDVINAVKPSYPHLPIVVRTGHSDIDMAIEAMKAGASDFIQKVDTMDHLESIISQTLRDKSIEKGFSELSESKQSHQLTFDDIIGNSQTVQSMVSLGEKVAKSDIPVLLEGESGCGKEFMARAIHNASDRKNKPFIAVNCGAIPENLVESILFGHEKGSFTGALFKTFGKFREADGGTIFLDEIGELKPDIQVKLLRVLQEGEIDPVGSSKAIKVDVRIISATNRNLIEMVQERRFREDLYYRLNVFPIHVPPLRERQQDISLLITHYMNQFIVAENKRNIVSISQDAKDLLAKYTWPGNIRQLKNAIFRAVVLCENNELKKEDFPQVLQELSEPNPGSTIGQPTIMLSEWSLELAPDDNFLPLQHIEKDVIQKAISFYHGHMSKVAKALGIGRSTLYRKLHDYGLDNTPSTH